MPKVKIRSRYEQPAVASQAPTGAPAGNPSPAPATQSDA